MTVGSLFSGIGGIDLGLERAGMEIRWQVEIDEFCRRVLAKHWPHVRRYEDVRRVGAHNLERVDVVAGGFPCQDISIAGAGAGIEGARSGLWFEFARVVRELRPRFVLVENVAALTFRGLDRVLGALAESGYDAEWQVLPAAAFGAPHVRERLFVVAYTDGERLKGPVFEPGIRLEPKTTSTQFGDESITCGHEWAHHLASLPVGDGIPTRLVRRGVMALGNAVVPQVAEWIGRRIMEVAAHVV